MIKFSFLIKTIYLSGFERLYTNQSNINLYKCFFQRFNSYNGEGSSDLTISNSNYGGIIYSYNVPCNLIIKETIFYNCSCTGGGGAIYFDSNVNGTSIFIDKVCGYNCFTTSSYKFQFAALATYMDYGENFINYISMVKCSDNRNIGYESLTLGYGINIIKSLNSSNNFGERHQGLRIWTPLSFKGIFLNIINNNSSESYIFEISYNLNNNLTYSNFINNFCLNKGIISITNCNLIINDCIILNNKMILFYLSNGNLNLNNNYILHETTFNYGIISINNLNIFNLTNTLQFKYYSTFKCYAINPINFKTNQLKKINLISMLLINLLIN